MYLWRLGLPDPPMEPLPVEVLDPTLQENQPTSPLVFSDQRASTNISFCPLGSKSINQYLRLSSPIKDHQPISPNILMDQRASTAKVIFQQRSLPNISHCLHGGKVSKPTNLTVLLMERSSTCL
ncbi:hypothetical protein PoB_002333200 [Plakobranchus ocellatus]|uniref:Uncharacterized protein n=1 Tax=Plakobranchus ocellatus TaxID=259542 RepID=A0AAV3ZNP1_9GAST|nr:hypothetical protein PoB_002333200 [Plakobranchus ocellatus]